ncbi:translation initiation factor IF-2-like isoform X2 [Gallus gallus]|uniref:translation initiation factor IF-2-like isoform X2 n=1 Tax=Gallus gallus TaxID=9031 RepID=UPI001AE2ECCC|nr:translation initiation factor IF-2-like isoform X2 [Gallus gallus]
MGSLWGLCVALRGSMGFYGALWVLWGSMGFGAAHGETLKATAAGSALLRCDSALRGSPPAFLPPRLRWTRVGAAEEAPPLLLLAVGRGGGALGLGKGGALVLPRLRLSQSGPYVCQMGGAVSTTLVNVEGSKKLFLAAPIGSNVTLQCPVATPPAKATPTRKATPPARWFHWGHRIHRGAWPEGAELKLGPMGENHVGRYDCAIGERSGTVHVVLGEAQSLRAPPGASLEVPCRPPPPKKQPETARPTLLLLSPPPPPSQVTWFRGGYSGRTSGPPILKGWAAPGGGLGPMGALFLWGLRRSQSGRYRCEWAGLRGHAPNASHASDLSHAPGLSHARDLSPAHDLSHARGLSPAPKGWDFPSPLPPLKGDPIFYGAGVWGDSNMGDFDGGGGGVGGGGGGGGEKGRGGQRGG